MSTDTKPASRKARLGHHSVQSPHFYPLQIFAGLPWWLSGKESACQCRRHRFGPWVGKTPWSRKGQPTPVFLPGKSHEQRSMVGHSPWGHKESDTTEPLSRSLLLRRGSSQGSSGWRLKRISLGRNALWGHVCMCFTYNCSFSHKPCSTLSVLKDLLFHFSLR